MSATLSVHVGERTTPTIDTDRGHRIRLRLLYLLAIASNLAIFIYGFDYYKLSVIDRPFSPKHQMLRPSGPSRRSNSRKKRKKRARRTRRRRRTIAKR